MKKLFLLIIVFAAIGVDNCYSQPGSKAINLKFNMPKGSGYDYNMTTNIGTKVNAGGQDVNVDNTMGFGYHFDVLDDSAGWKKMSATISKIVMNINTGGMNMNYDSDKPMDTADVMSATFAKTLGNMKGAQFGFTMNGKGEIGSVTGINEIVQHMSSGDDNSMGSEMGNPFNEENFKQNMQAAFGSYPDKPVKPGDSWKKTTTTTNAGILMNMESVYTLESYSGNIANVSVNSKISSSDATLGFNGTMKGLMQYDTPTGMPVDGDLIMTLNMNVNTGGQALPINMDIKMKITGKKS
jgi:hypothetical protein